MYVARGAHLPRSRDLLRAGTGPASRSSSSCSAPV